MPAFLHLLLLAAFSATSLSFASISPLPATADAMVKRGVPRGGIAFRYRESLTVRGGSTEGGASCPDEPTPEPAEPTVAAAAPEAEPGVVPPPVAAAATSVAVSVGGAAEVDPNGKMGPNAPPPGFLRKLLPSFPWHALPNLLTYLRCIAIPLFVFTFYWSDKLAHIWTSTLFAAASLTDFLDGYLARRWDITSAFGAFLDPVADKLMVSTALVLLSGRYGASVAIPSAIILAREIAVSALREWMAQRGQRDSVKVGMQGKVKTAATMVALTMLLAVPAGEGGHGALAGDALTKALYQPSMALLILSAVVTVTSGSVYFRAAAPVLMGKE